MSKKNDFAHDAFSVRDHRDDQRSLTDDERAEWARRGLSTEFCARCGADTVHVRLVCTCCGE